MKSHYCQKCGRFLLNMGYGVVEVKCANSRCKHLNKLKIIDQATLAALTLRQEADILRA